MNVEIEDLTRKFVASLEAYTVERVNTRLRDVLAIGLVGETKKVRAEVRKAPSAARRKGPIQLCPAPNCKSPAAPVFRMLCAKHKDTPRKTVQKWREARRRRKAK